jgi:hypothetical protein
LDKFILRNYRAFIEVIENYHGCFVYFYMTAMFSSASVAHKNFIRLELRVCFSHCLGRVNFLARREEKDLIVSPESFTRHFLYYFVVKKCMSSPSQHGIGRKKREARYNPREISPAICSKCRRTLRGISPRVRLSHRKNFSIS